jgi:hypothetical protein
VRASRRLRNAAEPSGRRIVSAARSVDSASADGCVPIEIGIGIGEAAGATVEERRDAHELVVAPGQMRGAARPAPSPQ